MKLTHGRVTFALRQISHLNVTKLSGYAAVSDVSARQGRDAKAGGLAAVKGDLVPRRSFRTVMILINAAAAAIYYVISQPCRWDLAA